jgi:hypothetical protein
VREALMKTVILHRTKKVQIGNYYPMGGDLEVPFTLHELVGYTYDLFANQPPAKVYQLSIRHYPKEREGSTHVNIVGPLRLIEGYVQNLGKQKDRLLSQWQAEGIRCTIVGWVEQAEAPEEWDNVS